MNIAVILTFYRSKSYGCIAFVAGSIIRQGDIKTCMSKFGPQQTDRLTDKHDKQQTDECQRQ